MKLEKGEMGLWEERCYDGRRVKLGKRVNLVYGRKSTPEGTRSSPESNWVVFLVDFSSKPFAGIGPM